MTHSERPTDMLLRQLAANRSAARDSRHHGHLPQFRPHFINDIILLRRELRARKDSHDQH